MVSEGPYDKVRKTTLKENPWNTCRSKAKIHVLLKSDDRNSTKVGKIFKKFEGKFEKYS